MIRSSVQINKCRYREPPDCKLIFTKNFGMTAYGNRKMNFRRQVAKRVILLLMIPVVSGTTLAATESPSVFTNEIPNYLDYSDTLSSAGQPLAKHIPLLAGMGFDQIIYLALTTSNTAIQKEDELVGKNGMEYVHVAVDFSKPSLRNFELVAAILNSSGDQKSLIHCQVNYRASTFSFLYRVIYLGVPVDEAKRDLDKVWGPDPVWYRFIIDTLAAYGMSHECDACDWQEREFD